MSECCICTRPDDLECPSCDQPFCFSCFVDHGKQCYEEMKQKAEQKKCSVCGRYASINPTVHCSDCQIEICRSCLYAHRKTHEAEKAKANWRYCVQCGLSKIVSSLDVCSICHGYVCNTCKEAHQFAHTKSYARCSGCGERTATECDEQERAGFKKCIHCKREYSLAYAWVYCSQCKQQFCLKCSPFHQETYHNARQEYGRVNLHDFKINFDTGPMEEALKNARKMADEIMEDIKRQARAEAEEERLRQEQKAKEEARHAREKAEQEAWFKNFWNTGNYDAYYSSSGIIEAAFSLLQLSTRATVQEVKRARNRLAKQGEYRHPDVGGTKEQFVKLNNAYELALSHAQRNER